MQPIDFVSFLITAVLVPVLAQVIKMLTERFGLILHRSVITIVVAALSLVLAFFAVAPILPSAPDPMAFIQELIVFATAITGTATIFYNLFLSKLFEKIGLLPESKRLTPG